MPSGRGTWYGADGSRLEGQFRGGMANGHGILRAKNGDKIEGEFVNQMPHGKVLLQRVTGERIEGQFRCVTPTTACLSLSTYMSFPRSRGSTYNLVPPVPA